MAEYAGLIQLTGTSYLDEAYHESSVQNLQTSVREDKQIGFYSLCTIYVTLCLTTLLISGQFVASFTPKWSLAIGALCYVTFLIANRWPSYQTLLPTAAILGFGGGILWAAQGAYLTIASANYAKSRLQPRVATMGLFTGIFFGIFQLSQVVGNLISSFVLKEDIPPDTPAELASGEGSPSQAKVELLMTIYIIIGSVASGSLLFLRNEVPLHNEQVLPSLEKNNPDKKSEEEEKSVLQRLFSVILLCKEKRMALLLPLFFFSGLEQGFFSGSFTGDIIHGSVGVAKVGFIMALYGGVNTIASLAFGKISDSFGNKPIVAIAFLAHLSFFACFYTAIKVYGMVWKEWFHDHEYLLYIGAGVHGIANASTNTFTSLICSLFFTDEAGAAFSNLKFLQSLGGVLSFAIGSSIRVDSKMVLCLGFWALSLISTVTLHVFVSPLDVEKRQTEDDSNEPIEGF